MRRREFLWLVGGAAAWPVSASGQSAMPVIGFLGVSSPEAFSPRFNAFRKGLAEAGFVENRNVEIDYRWAHDADRLPALAADLVQRKVNVIATGGSPAPALAAKAATSTIPIVFATPGSDPIELGLVSAINRPSENVTGVGFVASTISSKQMELLHETIAEAAPVGLLVNSGNPNIANYITNVRAAADTFGRRLLIVRAPSKEDLDAALATLIEQRVAGLIAIPDVFFFRRRYHVVTWAARHAIPAIYASRDFPEADGLMSYGTDIDDAYRQEGVYVGHVLRGEKPADLPAQQAVRIELVINLQTAAALGLTIPLPLLARADEVIE
jgi:putative ABC transport system substrate-binding protein